MGSGARDGKFSSPLLRRLAGLAEPAARRALLARLLAVALRRLARLLRVA
ncbi:hypothetical protein G3I65_33860, partial [Amycolatopsis sp. SID8362]|nr:hypothetical protein [Amycolatopsis sp. SID8362]